MRNVEQRRLGLEMWLNAVIQDLAAPEEWAEHVRTFLEIEGDAGLGSASSDGEDDCAGRESPRLQENIVPGLDSEPVEISHGPEGEAPSGQLSDAEDPELSSPSAACGDRHAIEDSLRRRCRSSEPSDSGGGLENMLQAPLLRSTQT